MEVEGIVEADDNIEVDEIGEMDGIERIGEVIGIVEIE